jgi:RNA-binding motif X-linked protein 2
VRDKETGKSKGFAFLKYEDQRSTDLAVDNLGGAVVQGAQGSRTLRVDHTRYKKRDDKPDEGIDLTGQNTFGEPERAREDDDISEDNEERPMLKEELELAKLIREHDDDDPMKAFLIEEKKEEVKLALEVAKKRSKRPGRDRKTSHGHRSHRTRERDHQIEDGHSTHRPRKIDYRSNQESSRRHRRDSRSRSRSRDNVRKDRHGRDGDSAPRHHSRQES